MFLKYMHNDSAHKQTKCKFKVGRYLHYILTIGMIVTYYIIKLIMLSFLYFILYITNEYKENKNIASCSKVFFFNKK